MPLFMTFFKNRLQWLPVVATAWIVISCIITYAVSVFEGQVEAFLPYISYTATNPPGRCIFGQLVNIGVGLLLLTLLIRFLQQARILAMLSASTRWKKVNTASVYIGVLSAIGLSMVANFQTPDMRIPHYFGVFLACVMSCTYVWLQFSINIRFKGWVTQTIVQLVHSLAISVLLVIAFVTAVVYRVQKHADVGTKWGVLRPVFLISSISEWLLVVAIVSFAINFFPDFRQFRLKLPDVYSKDRESLLQNYKKPEDETPQQPMSNGTSCV